MTKLADRVADIGQGAIAVTDHGVMFGAVKLQEEAARVGIKPIVGCELYVCTGDSIAEPARHTGDNWHLTVLAKNKEGYRNLMRLTTEAHLRGLSYKPRVDRRLLAQYSEGLIVLSGCIASEVAYHMAYEDDERHQEKLAELMLFYTDVFGDRFWIEVQAHGHNDEGLDYVAFEEKGKDEDTGEDILIPLMSETKMNHQLANIAKELGVGVVATNDCHYLTEDDGDAHDTLLCLGTGAYKFQPGRLMFPGVADFRYEFHMKTQDEMLAGSDAWYWEEACHNTGRLAETIDAPVIDLHVAPVLPKYDLSKDDPGFNRWLKTGKL